MGRTDLTRELHSDDQQAVLPDQFFAGTEEPAAVEGERRLILAVLADAIQAFQKHAGSVDTRGQALFREVEEWFMDPAAGAVLSFEYIGEALGLDVESFRCHLRAWQARRSANDGSVGDAIAEPDEDEPALRKASGE
jgi:hypothetical protein